MVEELKRIEEYAEDNNVPIMTKEGITFLTEYIKKHKVKKILEIKNGGGKREKYKFICFFTKRI